MRLALALVLTLLAVDATARADEPGPRRSESPAPEMVAAMRRYFSGELDEAAAFLGVGTGTAFIGGALATRQDAFGIGAAIAILPVSAIEIGAGLVLLVRTRGQLADLEALYRTSPARYRAEELPRMQRVNQWFDVYMGIEIGLVGLGVAGIVFGAVDDRSGFVGAGIGLASQASSMLTFDLVASDRADRYTERIEALRVRPVLGPASLGVAGSF